MFVVFLDGFTLSDGTDHLNDVLNITLFGHQIFFKLKNNTIIVPDSVCFKCI